MSKTGKLGRGQWSRTFGWYIGSDTAWEQGIPWWRPPAIDWLEKRIQADWTVLEWGSGASTVWLARMGCDVLSLELDPDWHGAVEKRLAQEGLKAQVVYFIPQDVIEERLQTYADHILAYDEGAFDLVVVDGRNRARCLANAQGRIKSGGYILLDDSQRAEYADGVRLYGDWPEYAWGDEGWMTTAWQRPEDWQPPAERVVLPNQEA